MIKKGLWEHVFIELDTSGKTKEEIENEWAKVVAKRSTKKMSEARARMITRVEMLQLVHMHEWDPMVIWQKLTVTHQVQGLST